MPKIIDDVQIFEAVLRVVGERGFSGATTKQIAKTAGISEVTLFRRFGSKQELVQKSAKFVVQQSDMINQMHYTGDIHADLTLIIETYMQTAVKFGDFVIQMIIEFSHHPSLLESFEQPIGMVKTLVSIIHQYQEDGILRKEHPLEAAVELLGPLLLKPLLLKVFPKENLSSINAEDHITRFLHGRYIGKD